MSDEARAHLEQLFTGLEGFVALGVGFGGHWNGKGTYEFRSFAENFYVWPAQADAIIADADKYAPTDDVYICPLLRRTGSRKEGTGGVGRFAWADLDTDGPAGWERAVLGPSSFVVESGRGLHPYLWLSEPLPAVELELLNQRLADALGADAGWSQSKYLRLAGTLNHKADPPLLVRQVELTRGDRDLALDELDEILPNHEPSVAQITEIEAKEPTVIPIRLLARLDEEAKNRSDASFSFVAACLRAGLDEAETMWLALQHRPTVDKYGRRAAREIGRSIGKAREEAAAQARPSGNALTPEIKVDDGVDTDHAANLVTTKTRRIRVTKIADVIPKRVEWGEEGLIALGMLTGLVAAGGVVKGLYGVHVAAKLAMRGEKTLFVCSEDALDYIVRPRFEAAGCDASLAYALSIDGPTGEDVPHFPSDLPLLAQAVKDVGPRLVIVDPIASYIDEGLDMGKNNEMRLILQPLIALARDANIAILAVYHLGKQRDRGAIGTVAFEDACRLVLTAARDDEDEDVRHIEMTKSNITPTGYGRKFRIVETPLDIDGETVGVAKLIDEGRSGKSVKHLLARKGTSGPEPEKRELARELLIEALVAAGVEGCKANETKGAVAKSADVSQQTVWRAFGELKDDGLAQARAERDEFGAIREWIWLAKAALLLGRNDA